MDPFSLATAVFGLAGVSIQVINIANSYVSSVIHRKESIRALISELRVLKFNFESLDKFLRSEMTDVRMVFERTSVLRSCTAACEEKLRALLKNLSSNEDSQPKIVVWPLGESEHQKTIEDLRAFAQWLHFALTIDGCSLLARTSNDVLEILGNQL